MMFVDKPFEASEIKATGCFVLGTTIAGRRRQSDVDLLRAYKEQQVVELDFQWLKVRHSIAPV